MQENNSLLILLFMIILLFVYMMTHKQDTRLGSNDLQQTKENHYVRTV